jgi:hypothetical protein
MSTISASARSICTTALSDLNVTSQGETPSAADLSLCFDHLNTFMDALAVERGTMYTQAITTYTYPASTPNGVTFGPGGDWDQARPEFLSGANYVVPGSSPPVRIPLGLMDDETYFALGIPTLTSNLPTQLYYNPNFASPGGLGTVTLYPVPTQDISIGLQTPTALTQFADLDTLYLFPPSYRRFIRYNFLMDVCDAFGRELTSNQKLQAFTSKQAMKTPNFDKLTLAIDPAVTQRGGSGYVIYSDTKGWGW